MFPEKVFQAPYGGSWNKTRFGSGAMSEQEAIFGGKFKIVGFDNGKMQVETVVDAARENGGAVNSGRPYLVGEKGPEVFVPRNSGGIIPNYALGGLVKSGKTGYGNSPAGMVGKYVAGGLAANIAFMLAPHLLAKMGAPKGLTDNFFPAMMAGQMALGGRALYKRAKAAQSGAEIAGDAMKAEGALAKLSPRFLQLAGAAKFAAGPIGIVVTGLQVYQMLENNRKKNQEIYSVSFGLTAKTAKEAGIQVKKLDDQLKASSDAAKSTSSKAALLFSQDSAGIQGLSLTNKELKDLEQSVKKTMPTYVQAFKKMSGNEIVTGATRIKAQWVAMGMSVEEANKKIYALVKTTHGADSALKAITSNSYKAITDKATAAKEAITLVGIALKNVNKTGASGAAASLDTFFQIQTARLEQLKAEALKSDKTKDMPAESSYLKLMKEYSNSGAGNIKITREVISELAKTQPVLASILNATDTIGSSMSKWIIATSGTIPNLERIASLTAAQANTVAKGIVAVQDASKVALSSDKEVVAKQKALADAKARLINAEKASAGMSVKDQVGAKNRIKALEAEIKKIEEAAAARKKAMQEQQTNSDVLLQIQKKQLDYQQALASGDSAAAAQAQLDIQQISGSRQTQMAMNAIDTNTTNLTGPLKDEMARLNDSLQKSADAAAIAADSASSIAKTIASLSEKETALKTSLQKALNDKLLYGVDSKSFASDIKVMFNDYVQLLGLKPDKNGVYKNSDGKVITPEGIYAALEKTALKELSINGQNVYVIAAGKLLTGKDLTGTGDSTAKLPPKQQAAIKKEEQKPYEKRDPNVPLSPAKGSGGAMHNPKYKPNQNLGPSTAGMLKNNIVGDYLYAGNGLVYLKDDPSQMVGQWYTTTQAGRIAYGSGGSVNGPGTSTSDSIPAYLSNGEYVVRESAVKQYGIDFFDSLNAQKFHTGGAAGHKHDIPSMSAAPTGAVKAANDKATEKWYKENNYYKDYRGEWVKRGPSQFEKYTTASNWKGLFQNSGGTGAISDDIISKILTMSFGPKASKMNSTGKDFKKGEWITGALNLLTAGLTGSVSNAFGRALIEQLGISKGIPGLGALLPKGSLPFLGAAGSKLATNAATVAAEHAGLSGLSNSGHNALVKSIYKRKDIEAGGFIFPTYTVGKQKVAFQGFEEDLSALANSQVKIVKTDPQSLLKAALEIKPNNKNIKKMLENFNNKKIGTLETQFIDNIAAAISINKKGKDLPVQRTDGFAMLLSSLTGNKNAKNIIDFKRNSLLNAVKNKNNLRQEQINSDSWVPPGAGIPADPKSLPMIHSTKFPITRDKDGNIILNPYSDHNIGTDIALPRASLHFTLEDSVKSHLYGSWGPLEKKIVSPLSSMIKDNGMPYNLNSTDTWWMRNPGQSLKISDASVIHPFSNQKMYTEELIKRGLIKNGEMVPLVISDPATKDVLQLFKEVYSPVDRLQISRMISDQGLGYIPRGNSKSLLGKEAEYLDQIALQFAKKQVGIDTGLTKLDSHSLSNTERQNEVYRLAKELKLSGETHSGSWPEMSEKHLNTKIFGKNRNATQYPSTMISDSLEALRAIIYNGRNNTNIRKLKNPDDFDGFAIGGYVGKRFDIPKFKNGINSVPVNMLAELHKNEAVIPANMNPFNPNANNATMGGTVYNVANVTMQFAEAPVNGKALFADFKEAIRIENSKVGGTKEFGSRVMNT
jgi:hypothetical protein